MAATSRGPAKRGKRVALADPSPREAARQVVAYVCGAKPLDYGEHTLTQGVEVPGAAGWTRLEAWVGARRVRPVYEGEEFITFEEFCRPQLDGTPVTEVATTKE